MNAPRKTILPHFRIHKDYESNLSEFRVSAGLTISEICEQAGIRPSEYTVLNSGQRSPLNKSGNPCDQALKLCSVLNVDLSDLWPRYFCTINQSEEYPSDQVINSFHSGMKEDTPEEIYERRELAIEVKRIVDSMEYKERKALLRMNSTLDQIGEDLGGLTRERVRQIEVNAYQSMTSAMRRSTKKELFEFLDLRKDAKTK